MTWIQSNWPTILNIVGATITLLSIINGMIKSPVAKNWVTKIIDALSFIARAGAQGSVKAPFTLSRPLGTPAATVPLAMFLPFLFIGLTMSGCLPPLSACVNPVANLQAKCTFENNLISCGEKTGFDLVPVVADVVMSALGGTFDSATLVAELESEGMGSTAPCVLAAVEGYLMPVAPQIAAKVHMALAYKLQKDGRHGIVDVKLKNGYVSHVVLP